MLGAVLGIAASMASSAAAQEAACSCVELHDALALKVEANYPGYHLEIAGTTREASYRRHRAAMREKAEATAPGLECTYVLQDYIAWFEDGHLFVGGSAPVATAADSARLREAAPHVTWTEPEVLRYLARTPALLDPIEGLWVDPVGLRIAVVRADRDVPARSAATEHDSVADSRFVAFILSSVASAWKPGDVRAELEALPDGSYDAVLYDDVRSPTHPHVYVRGATGGARLQRNGLLLHMPPTTWGRLHPVAPGLEGRIDPREPRAPTARTVGGGTVVFHVPSNVPAHAVRLHLLIDQYRGALARADNLIIDLRGNEGGSTFVTDAFLPFMGAASRAPRHHTTGASAVLASADNAAHFERMSWAPAGLVGRLREAEAGSLVPFADPQPSRAPAAQATPATVSDDVTRNTSLNVAILTDAMTVSAAEAFVMKAMQYESVTLFGQPTGSSIDYQSVGIVRFGCPAAGLFVGYPTIIGSDRLPEGGVRPTGIVPDILIDAADPDPVSRIIQHYRRGG